MLTPGRLNRVVAQVMRHERQRHSLRQVDLATLLDWPVSRVIRIETGIQRVLADDLIDLCEVLGLGVADLLAQADPGDLRVLGLAPGSAVAGGPDRERKAADPHRRSSEP